MTWQGALKPVKSGTFTPVVTYEQGSKINYDLK